MPSDTPSRDARLHEVIAAFLGATTSGVTPDRERWLRSHPDLADDLRAFFADHDRMNRAAAPVRAALGDDTVQLSSSPETFPQPFGDYELLEEIGRGGMGIVYLARQVGLNRLCALKMILAGGHASEADLGRFRTEAEAVARLQHANIVQVFEVGVHEGRPFLSLELCPGGSLEQKLRVTPLGPREAAELVKTLAAAVQAAHEARVIHRDLKPANVLLGADGTPKVADFGLAKKLDETSGQTRTGAVVGTPSYMAPEQAAGGKDVGPAADTYALGAILYDCLTGRPPFKAATAMDTLMQVMSDDPVPPTQLNARVARDLETITLKCLRKDAGRRYASAGELAEDLRRWLAGEPITARPVGRLERARKWVRRNPTAALAGGLAAVLVAMAIGGLTAMTVQERHNARRLGEQKRRTDQRAAAATLGQGQALCENGEVDRGLVLIAQALELAEQAEDADLDDACRWNLAAWSAEMHRLRQVIDNGARIESFALSPDGKTAAAGGAAGAVRLWDLETGRQIGPTLEHPAKVTAVAFHPREPLLLTGCVDGQARLWGLTDGRQSGESIRVFEAEELKTTWHFKGGIDSVAFSPDGGSFATTSVRRVKLWDTATRRPAGATVEKTGWVCAVAFTPAGDKLVTVGLYPREHNVWSLRQKKFLLRDGFAPGRTFCLAVSPNGRTALLGLDGSAQQFAVADGRAVGPALPSREQVRAVAYSSSGRTLAAGGTDNVVRLFKASSGLQVGMEIRLPATVTGVGFTPDGRLVASAGDEIRVWELVPGLLRFALTLPSALRGTDPRASSAAFSPDGRSVVVGYNSSVKHAVRWDVGTGRMLRPVYPFPPYHVTAVAYSPDGREVYAASSDGRVKWWDARTARLVGEMTRMGPAPLPPVVFSRDGRRIAGGSSRTTTGLLWDVATGKTVAAPPEHALARGLAFSHDDRRLMTASGNEVRFWDADTGAALGPPRPHPVKIINAAFSPDGDEVLTAGWDGGVRRYRTTTWEKVGRTAFHTGEATAVGYALGGRLLLSASMDFTARLWHPATGVPVGPPMRHGKRVGAAVEGPDAGTLVTGGDDGVGKVWMFPSQPTPGRPADLRRAVERAAGLTWDEQDGFRPVTAGAW